MANESFSYEEAFGLGSETRSSPHQGGGFSYEEAFGAPPAKDAAAPGFIPTIKRTGGQMLTTAATAAEDVVGPNAVTRAVHDTGQGIIDRNPAGIRRLRDLIDSPVLAVKEAVGQFVPQIGAAAAGGFAGARAGGAIGALAGPGGAATGALVGGAAGSLLPIFTQEYGGIRQEQKEAGQEDKARALAAAIPATALERIGMGKALNVLKGVPVGAGSVLKEAGKGVLKEGATEGTQNVIEQWGAFKDPTTGENLEDTALSAAMGGIGGGVVNGATGAVDRARSRSQERQRAQVEEQARGRAIEAAESADQLSTEASIEHLAGAPINPVDRGEPATFEDLVTPRPQEEPDPFTAWEQEAVARQAADQLERERQARAAGVDYQPGDATPQWDTAPGAVSARGGELEMPAPDFDTGSLGLESTSRALTPSQRMGIDPAAGPVSKVAAIAADAAPASDAQFIAATGRDLAPRRTGPGLPDDSNVIDVQGRLVDDGAIGTPRRLTATTDGDLLAGTPVAAAEPINLTGEPLRLDAANVLRNQAREAGLAASIVPHASGRGYDVVPQLPAPAAPSTPPVVAARDGAPFATPAAAQAELQRQQLGATHRIAPAGGDSSLGFVLEKNEQNQTPALMQSSGVAIKSGSSHSPNWRTNALQAGRVAREMGLDPKGKRLAQVVAEIDAADAQRVGVRQDGADLSAGKIDREWSAFAPETGTLGVPRAEMPQIKAEHRGALVNFLKARGIDSQAGEVPANDLKPTQAEFSPAKVEKARAFQGGDRSILVSADGYVVDGHHQWLAKRANGEPVKVIRLQAPIRQVLAQTAEFPSTASGRGAQHSGNPAFASEQADGQDQRRAAAQQQRDDYRAAEAKRTAPGARARSAAADANPFKAFIAKHGIALDQRREFAPGTAEQRQAMVPGYGPIFRRTGMPLDLLAQSAVDEGFLISPDAATLHDLIGRALRGERIVAQYTADAAEAEMQSRIARQRDMEEDAASAVADLSDTALFDLNDDDIVLTADSNTSTEDAMRSLGFTEQEIQDVIAQESAGTPEGSARSGGAHETDTSPAQGSAGQGTQEAQPQRVTRQDLLGDAPNESQQAAARERARRQQQDGAQRNAAPGPDDFTLGMVDANTGREVAPGQGSIFDAQQQDSSTSRRPASTTASSRLFAPELVALGAEISGAGGESISSPGAGHRQDRAPRPGPRQKSEENQVPALDQQAQVATKSGANSAVNDPRPARAAAPPRPAARIDDFGETLHGARKMLYAEAYADGMAKGKELDTKAHPLSKTWPEPDYQKLLEGGAPVEAVSMARALRESVPTKPQSAWKLKGWATKVEALRGFAEDVLSGRLDTRTVEESMERSGLRGVPNKAALYAAMGHERSLKGIELSVGRYSMYDRVEYNPPRTIWTVSREAKGSAFGNWPRELAKGDTREEAIAAFKKRAAELLTEDQAPAKGATFEIYGKRAGGAREFFIGKKIGRKVAELKAGFPDLKAAREYKAAHQSELEDLLAKYKAVPPVRNAQNAPRIGEDYRKGADVTAERFQDAFGFRGVQFGNYVEGSRRQQDLNRAYDALMDLAAVLGLPPRALSLGGRLGLAFGARGTGGTDAAAAHYEPTTVVINLTKKQGAGSLAHEWWHGLDNYFSRQRGDGGSFMTSESRSGDGVREEMRAAFREVISAINRTGMQERSRKLDDRRTKEYWTTKPEMSARAFESYVIAKLQDQNAGNDYLANVVGDAMFALEGAYPYPTAGELPQIRAAFDGFFQTVETREGDGGATVLYNTSDSAPPARGLSLEQAQQAVQQALAGLRNAPPVDIVGRSKEVWVDAPDSAMGAAIPGERRIVIAASAHGSADAVVETLFHEMFHLGLRNVLPASDYVQSMLDLAKRDSRVQEYANKWKKEAPEAAQQLQALRQRGHTGSELTAQYEALAIEEGLAVVAEELRAQKQAGTRLGMRVRVLAGWLAGVAERMGMQRLADSIRKMTYNEAERFVLKAIEHAGRAPISPDSADVPRYRASGQAETPAFRNWFGDSKVVDGTGQPLRVFHGTGGDFNAFSRDRAGATTGAANAGMGFFFTDRPEVAGKYARMAGDAQNILPVYLSLKNPLRLEAKNMMEADRMLQSGLQEKHDGAIIQVAMRDGGTQTVYMVRESGQAKSATGNRGTFDAVNPDIRYRTGRAAVESSMGPLTTVQERVWKKVAGVARVPTLRERAEALTQNIGVRAKQALVDQFAPIQDVSQEAYMLARLSKGADGTMEAAMLYGRPYLRDGVPDVDVKDGGFAKVLASLKGEHDRFLWWVAAQRADRLKAEGKENLMSIDDIGVLKTLNAGTMADGSQRAPVYAKAAAQLMAFNESALKMSLESGLIDQAAYDIMKEQPYVPFYRLMAEDGGMPGARFSSGLTNQNFAKKLKGGTEQLNADLLENLLLNWSHLYAATARNRAAVATMDAAEKMGVAYPVLEPVKGSVRVMRDGQAQHWMVEDPYLLEAISALHYTSSPLMKPLAKMKQLLTWGVTVNPTFKIRNLMRDSLAAIAQSELGYNPAANVKRGWNLTAEDSQVYASMLASGGVIKFGTQENTERAREQVKKLGGVVLDQKGWHKLSGQLATVWKAYGELGDRLENVNRVALYDRLVAQGHSHAEASFMARDLMDFSMSGNHAVVRFLTQSVPFLNARLQGLYKLGRAAHDNPRRFVAVAGAVSLASLALLAMFGDDEDWKKREDWDRDSYWWFKIGEQAYRIPKPFEVGAIGTLAERTAELMFSDEMTNRRFMERLGHMLAQTFSFDPMPQAFKPLVDIYSNQDSFTGRAIESQADQRLRAEDRYDERTSEVARLLGSWGLPDPVRFLKGEWSELSPKQVDHLLRGYFSWAGTTAAAVADTIARPALDRGARPDQRLKDLFVLGNFVESLPSGSSRYVTQMYEQARQVEQAHASYRDAIKRGDLEKAEEIQRDEAPKLRQRPAYANATRQLSNLNQRAKAVTASKELSGAEKRAALDAIERQRAEIGHRMNALAIAP